MRDREREWEKQQGRQKEKHRRNTQIVRHMVIFRYFRKISQVAIAVIYIVFRNLTINTIVTHLVRKRSNIMWILFQENRNETIIIIIPS